MKRFFALLLAAALALSLFGCGAGVRLPDSGEPVMENPPLTELADSVATEALPVMADLTQDGELEEIRLRSYLFEDADGQNVYELCVLKKDGTVLWSEQATETHPGWNALFLCPVGERDFLLRYRPTMYQGVCSYSYQLFSLDEEGNELVCEEDSLDFDLNFHQEGHRYDPEAIASFLETVNGYLKGSTVLLNTDEALAFAEGEPLRDAVWFLRGDSDFSYDEQESLLKNLEAYAEYLASATA